MKYNSENPLVVQSDRTILLETNHPKFKEARNILSTFAELERSPEHIHTYRISPLSLWNSASAGHSSDELLIKLEELSKYPIPQNVVFEIQNWMQRWGAIKLLPHENEYLMTVKTPALMKEILSNKQASKFITAQIDKTNVLINPSFRGHLKLELIKTGWPVEDLAGYKEGSEFNFNLKNITSLGKEFHIRDYQKNAAEAFIVGGTAKGGAGVISLPCGAGKTIVGIEIMRNISKKTLILTTNTIASRQWKNELLDKTTIHSDEIGEYSAEIKEIKPITIATYQILTHRKSKQDDFLHFNIFNSEDWGLIVYDEVHLLPAPVFRFTAELQSRRRLGLTATLVREDGRETDVFSLIGPKKYDVPWRDLERERWIASADCREVRVNLPPEYEDQYSIEFDREKFRIAAENPIKIDLVKRLIEKHKAEHVLVIGQFIDQLKKISAKINAPLITGKTSNKEREKLYNDFRSGVVSVLVVSRVANFAIDLPDANVAIEVSGLFGSRQEEAQRLGRILRPKKGSNIAIFYVLVTRNTIEETFAQKRQVFLVEQGYNYEIVMCDDIL